VVVFGFPPTSYKHTPAPASREREGEGGRRGVREAREEGVHRFPQNVIKCTRAPAGRKRERERGGREVREGGMHRHKLNVGMCVSLQLAHLIN